MQKDSLSLNVLTQHCSVANMESHDHNGKTPLMHAVENGLVENVSILLKKQVCKNFFFMFRSLFLPLTL